MKSLRNHLSPRSRGSKCSFIQSGYHQNLSGSDTDVSTSTENLTAEERRVLQKGIRQEPQGEETITGEVDIKPSNLVMHGKCLVDLKSGYYNQCYPLESEAIDKSMVESHLDPLGKYKLLYPEDNSHLLTPRSSPPIPVSPKSSHRLVYSNFQKAQIHNNWEPYSCSRYSNSANSTPHSSYSSGLYRSDHVTPGSYSQSVQGITEIPQDYLDQSEVLKYLAKELNIPEIADYSPTPDYQKQLDANNDHQTVLVNARRRGYGMLNGRSKSADRLTVSRSHPDLSNVKHYSVDESNAKISPRMQRLDSPSKMSYPLGTELSSLEIITTENAELKKEIEMYRKKVMKLMKFELEIQKVHKAYEDLVFSTDKKERLEQSIRSRLEMEIRRLHEQNKQLREHFESATSSPGKHLFTDASDNELRKELSKREVLISQLLTQTKELLAEKDRQEIELQAQRATLQEQRNHIDILDNALTNAQANVVRLEEETRKKQVYVERVGQLQKAYQNMSQSSEKRLHVEKKLRAQLEKELLSLKQQQHGKTPSVITSNNEVTENVESLKKTVMEYEEKIINLEAEVSKWEQRYIAESTMRQIAVDAASVPKDAKIAALERTSQESEKLIAQARTEKLKHMDELYAANRKCTELESRIKDFESKLAEKDAMIKVLQQHSQDKDTVFQNCVLGRPPRHTRAASTVGITTSTSHTTTTTGVSSLGRVSPSPTNTLHRRTGSASGSLLSISSDSSAPLPSQSSPVAESVTDAKKSIDEQLKELDSRLSSKDSIISALRAEKERYPNHFWRV